MSHATKRYTKLALSPADLAARLQAKGLAIPNMPLAIKALNRIGYYRLLIYMRPLQNAAKQFNPGTTFDQILELYNFDRELRLLCLDAIERVEVALRSAIINELSVLYGAHFHLNSRHFDEPKHYRDFLSAAAKASYLGISHYYKKYNDPSVPPVWTLLEGVTFGTLSRMFSQLHVTNRRVIAGCFKYPEPVAISWFRSLNNLRNMCAHHNRLWNAVLQVDQPMSYHKHLKKEWGASQNRFYARAVVIVALLKEIDPALRWKHDLKALFAKYSMVYPSDLGFPTNWQLSPFWN